MTSPPSPRQETVALIACDMFHEEVSGWLARRPRKAPEVKLFWLDAGWHMRLERLAQGVTAAIDEARGAGYENVKLLFGYGCLPEMADLARERGVGLLPAKNCLTAFLGEAEVLELEKNRTMVMTSAWVRLWPEAMRSSAGWDPVDFRIGLGRYDRLLVFETGAPLTDEEILAFFELAQVPLETRPWGPERFEKILDDFIDGESSGPASGS